MTRLDELPTKFRGNVPAYKKPSKYRNTKTEYDGVIYDSKREAQVGRDLELRFRAKDIARLYRQVRIILKVNGKQICAHVVDFEVIHNDGSKEWIEVKGFETPVYKCARHAIVITHSIAS